MDHETRSVPISVLSGDLDSELGRIRRQIDHVVHLEGRADLEALLGSLLRANDDRPRTLDLIGHSTAGHSLLVLGDWVIDSRRSSVRAYFRELADHQVMQRLNVTAIRLLGCETAKTFEGQATICRLAEILGIEVCGTTEMVSANHYDADGFRTDLNHMLLGASGLGSVTVGPSSRRVFDVDALPASPLAARTRTQRRIADLSAATKIMKLVQRNDGAQMPGVVDINCEIAIPSAKRDWYHLVQMVLGGDFVRVYLDGDGCPGIVFPVSDANTLREIVAGLPHG